MLYFAHQLPGSEYADYSTGLSISAISVQLSCGWLASSIIYFLPTSSSRRDFISDCIILSSALGIIAGGIGGLTTLNTLHTIAAAGIVSAICLTQSFYGTLNSVCQAERRISAQLVSSSIFSITLLAAGAIALTLYPNQNSALSAFALAYFFGALPLATVYLKELMREGGLKSLLPSQHNIVAIIRYGSPLSLWASSLLFLNSGEKFFRTNSSNFETYIITKDLLIGLSSLLSMPLIMAAHPIIFKAYRENRSYTRLITICCHLLSTGFGFAWCLIYFIGFEIIKSITLKNPHSVALEALMAFCGLYLSALAIYIQKPLEIHSKTTSIAVTATLIALASIPAFYIFSPTHDALGAALVFLTSQIAYITALALQSKVRLFDILKATSLFLATILTGYAIKKFVDIYFTDFAPYIKMTLWLAVYCAFFATTAYSIFKKLRIL